MKNSLETYKIWAPDDSLWTEWAKPVLFANSKYDGSKILNTIKTDWITSVDYKTMVIIDLPDKWGVEEGLSLARLGFRPIPLYNGVNGSNKSLMIVNVRDIVKALFEGADILKDLSIRNDAPPVFLLDANRMESNGNQPGKFDNRWCVFPQDMPSAAYLSAKGINQIIVRSNGIQNDLSHILWRYREKGIRILLHSKNHPLNEYKILKPSQFRNLFYRFKVISGLTRNTVGGFGGLIPVESGSGG